MKITLYTVNECQFSKQEKDYLTSHQLQFEEKNLELNKEFLTEMLAVSDNFAGTPVTKIEKDDGQSVVLKGFTQAEFDAALGYKTEAVVEQKDASTQPSVSEAVTNTPPQPNTAPPLSTPDLSGIAPVSNVVNDIGNLQTPVAVTAQSTPPTIVEPPTQLTQDPMAAPAPVQELPAAPAVESAKAPDDPKLASVLSNLQTMSSSSNAPASDTPTTPPPVGNMPSIPDPHFG